MWEVSPMTIPTQNCIVFQNPCRGRQFLWGDSNPLGEVYVTMEQKKGGNPIETFDLMASWREYSLITEEIWKILRKC